MNNINPRSAARLQPPAPAQWQDDEIDTFALFRVVRRRLPLIVAITLAITLLSLLWILPLQRYYYSESRLLIRTPLAANITGQQEYNPLTLDLSTESARLLSRSIVVGLIEDLGLAERPEFNPRLRPTSPSDGIVGSLRSTIRPEPAGPAPAVDDLDLVLPNVMNALGVQRLADIIVIGFSSLDPELAAKVPNEMVRIYLDEREKMLLSRVTGAEQWIDARIVDQTRRVSDALAAVKAFRDRETPTSEDLEGETSRAIADMVSRQADLQSRRSGLDADLAALETPTASPGSIGAVDTSAMSDLRRELLSEQTELAKLLEVYGENHPNVIEARAHIGETHSAMAAEAERYKQILRNQIAALSRQDATITASLAEAETRLARARGIQAQLDSLVLTAQIEQKSLATLEEQKRGLATQGALPVADVEVLSPASVPLLPYGRGRSFYLFAAFVAAGCAAMTAAFALELLDRGVRGLQQCAGVPNTRAAGLVPLLPRNRSVSDTLKEPHNLFAGSIHGVITAVERANNGEMPASLFVTSALPGAGKSTIALALSLALTARGRPTLLVDGDLRHGTVHLSSRLDAVPGLSDFLVGEAGLDAVVRESEALGLRVVTRGTADLPLRGVGSARAILDMARAQGMTVVIDGPPALASMETMALAGLAECSLVVARWGRTTRKDIALAAQRVHQWSLDETFLVLNMVDPKRYPLYGFGDAGLFSRQLRKYYGPSS